MRPSVEVATAITEHGCILGDSEEKRVLLRGGHSRSAGPLFRIKPPKSSRFLVCLRTFARARLREDASAQAGPRIARVSDTPKPFARLARAFFCAVKTCGLAFAAGGRIAVLVIGHSPVKSLGRPGNEEAECRNGCTSSDSAGACQSFCDCIYKQGGPLNACLTEYHSTKRNRCEARAAGSVK